MSGEDGFWFPVPDGGTGSAATEILATHAYNPATVTDVSTTSTTFSDVNATNLAVTFTAPASGKVLVDVSAAVYVDTGWGIDWCLRDAAGTIAGTNKRMLYGAAASHTAATLRNLLTGLTPTASYTVKLGHRTGVTGAAGGSVITRFGGSAAGNSGAALFIVTAVP